MELKEGDFVRLKRGVYKDDCAKVIYLDYSQSKVQVLVVPRLPGVGESRGKRVARPAQKLFDQTLVR